MDRQNSSPLIPSKINSLSGWGPARRRNSTGLAKLWGGWPIEQDLMRKPITCVYCILFELRVCNIRVAVELN